MSSSSSFYSEQANSQMEPKSFQTISSTDDNEEFIDDDDDDDSESMDNPMKQKKTKKTLGRVKIKMAYIDDKVRRYTTFSKRKTGIMKKAYELATLTGTEVMLLVASETGHVYTYATPKLQPMITSESGKALIQTCLEKDETIVESCSTTDDRPVEERQRKKRTSGNNIPSEIHPIKRAKSKLSEEIKSVNETITPLSTPAAVTVPLSCFFHLDPSQQSMPTSTDLNSSLKTTAMNVVLAPSPSTSQTSPSSNVPLVLTFVLDLHSIQTNQEYDIPTTIVPEEMMYANKKLSSPMYGADLAFRQSVVKIPSDRTVQDLTIINTYLKHLEALSTLRESHIRNLCKTIRYEIHDTHHVLFSRGDLNTCWYILLSGSVFIESTMYLPRASFGKRTPANPYRLNECVILEPSELLVIDYPSVETKESLMRIEHQEQDQSIIDDEDQLQTMTLNRKKSSRIRQRSITVTNSNDIHSSMIRSSHSRASDTSSAYSGSDIMQSSTNGDDCLMINNETDDESEGSSEHSFPIHDHIREVLTKEANERTDDDIEAILEFLHHFPAFADLTLHVRRELCKVLVYAQVEKAQTVVMNDGERYDSWSVIINGIIDDETVTGEPIRTLTVGQSFGCGPTLDQYCHKGIMKTRVDDCQFVVVAQNDYYAILNQGEKDVRKIEENGKIVMMKEKRIDDDEHRMPREIVIKATVEKLLDLLADERQLLDDPTFVEDFLLTYRTFLHDPTIVLNKLLECFQKSTNLTICEHVSRVILSWVNNHYNDFESNTQLNEFLEKFDDELQHHDGEGMRSWKYLLNLACFTRASVRIITLTRSTRDDVLNFNILGGSDTVTHNGIFVSKVECHSKAYEAGLRRGDQILNVNGQSFDYLTHARALEILRGSTHLSLTVKNNLMGFNEIINPEKSPVRKKRHDISLYEQEIRNKLNGSSPIRSHSTTTSPILPMSPTETYRHQARSPLTTIVTPTKNIPSNADKSKPRPLTKRMGLKRAVMQKLKITKNNR
ncbi:unnamed protein product [Adineta ricciae]|uniref:Uncharacterized protein n=2 Tax=Adineta ricciae TaxID=249248 RepID=A0A813ZYH4_ADIRI|nr:unnamed protein product [Adineta ricciae]